MVTRALRIEIARPVDVSWDELGVLLRTQRRVMAQLLRAGMDARIACGVVGAKAAGRAQELLAAGLDVEEVTREIVAETSLQSVSKDESPEDRAARIKATVVRLRKTFANRLATSASVPTIKGALKMNGVRGASENTIVYQAIVAELDVIQASKWRDESRPALDLPGGMLSALSQRVMQSYPKRPSFGGTQPIPVRKAETRLAIAQDEGRERIVLDLKFTANGRTRVYVRPSKGQHWHLLKQIAKGEVVHGDCRIVLDEDRKKWYALLSYEVAARALPGPIDPTRALIVHRGVRNALTLLGSHGMVRYEPGEKLRSQLRQLDSRKRRGMSISNVTLGDGAKGHGKTRRYEHCDPIKKTRKNVVSTWCGQMAAYVLALALEWGCGIIVIEDYGGLAVNPDPHLRRALDKFPLYQIKQAIKNAREARATNVELREVPGEYISTTCPACGCQDFRQHNIHTGTFHCASCELERPADFVAALHMGRRSGVDMSVWDERMKKYDQLRSELREPAE
jgi:transposase